MTVETPYDIALRTRGGCWVRGSDGVAHPLPLARWLGDADDTDRRLLRLCTGATLDVGCGPGRCTAALAERGLVALGVDVSAEAVRIARARGASALRRDVFERLPGEARWRHVLLADGNIGIGGDPAALLVRTRELLAPGGTVLTELSRPGTGLRRVVLRVEGPRGTNARVRWAFVGADAVADLAATAGLTVLVVQQVARRWVAVLRKA